MTPTERNLTTACIVLAAALMSILALKSAETRTHAAAPPVTVRQAALAITVVQNGLYLENRTDAPVDDCFVEIFGGYVARVPLIPAHSEVSRTFIALFDGSTTLKVDGEGAGKVFGDYAFTNATTKTTVTCRDITGRRLMAVSRGGAQ